MGLCKMPNSSADGRTCNLLWMILADFSSRRHSENSGSDPKTRHFNPLSYPTPRYLQEEKNGARVTLKFGKWHMESRVYVGGLLVALLQLSPFQPHYSEILLLLPLGDTLEMSALCGDDCKLQDFLNLY